MSHLNTGDPCPYCWHNPRITPKNCGIGTFDIGELISWSGGVLDKNKTCNECKWNFCSIDICVSCRPKTACPQHYAVLYNGNLNHGIPLEFHRLYMYNSPYTKRWSDRPRSIGKWYANQVNNYLGVIPMVRRFTDNYEVQIYLNSLESVLMTSCCPRDDFWKGFVDICRRFFSGNDPLSAAMSGFYSECLLKF